MSRSDLVDDGSGRLRDRRPTDDHPVGCGCAYCRTMCCVPCHYANPSITKEWKSIQGFGRHVQAAHPDWATFDHAKSKVARVQRAVRAEALAKEQRRFARQGLRTIPLKRFTDKHLGQMAGWVHAIERDPTSNLLLGAISLADERFTTRASYESMVRRLTADTREGIITGSYVTTERKTHFDPRVALEILKLCWALGRGWSFVVHLLLLYGINAFVEALLMEGISPPTQVRTLPKPNDLLNHTAKTLLEPHPEFD